MTPPLSPEEPNTATGRGKSNNSARVQAIKRVLILVIGISVTLAMTYFSGYKRGSKVANRAVHAQQAAEVRSTILERQVAQLEARRQLHLSLLALDDRNFGIAQRHLGTAGDLLARAEGDAEAAALATQIKGINIAVAGDFSAQRDQILALIKQLDGLLPATTEVRVPAAVAAP